LGEIVGLGRYIKKDMSKKARIVHVAMKVNDLDAATKFYENVFEFKQLATTNRDGHFSRHMTDGETDIALLYYENPNAPEADLAGEGPCIHHWGIEVEDRDAMAEKITQYGGVILSKPDAKAVKFRAPDGNVCEMVEIGGFDEYKKPASAA
jgi:lactoylglutathione lyase